jgi:ubiquinone/menaquinone biosynthesis C-methylase UbiE
MEQTEKIFEKYKTRGADYHWKEIIPINILAFNAYLHARYEIISKIISNTLSGHTSPNENSARNFSIADFGCGDGVQLHLIEKTWGKRANLELHGIDLSTEAISAAKKRIPNASLKIASTYESGFPNDYFDIAVSSDVIEHVLDPEKMLSEMIRVTKPGGHIIVATPIKYTEDPLDPMHVQEFFPKEFFDLLKKNQAIKIIKQVASHPLQSTIAYNKTVNIFGKRIPLFKYVLNATFLLTGYNPFRKNALLHTENKSLLMTYQFILAMKIR